MSGGLAGPCDSAKCAASVLLATFLNLNTSPEYSNTPEYSNKENEFGVNIRFIWISGDIFVKTLERLGGNASWKFSGEQKPLKGPRSGFTGPIHLRSWTSKKLEGVVPHQPHQESEVEKNLSQRAL